MRRRGMGIGVLCVMGVSSTACLRKSVVLSPAQQRTSLAHPVTDYDTFLDHLRALGVRIEPQGDVEQPFFSNKGRMLQVNGEEVQVFSYPDPTAAAAQAALVSPDGSAVGTSKLQWAGSPHFYRKGKLLVLYVGDNDQVRKALDTVLDRPFAGQP